MVESLKRNSPLERWENEIKIDLREILREWCGLCSSESQHVSEAGSCKHGDGSTGSLRSGKCIHKLRDK
jgi:hypothetical protein